VKSEHVVGKGTHMPALGAVVEVRICWLLFVDLRIRGNDER